MTRISARPWDESDVPCVQPSDLLSALSPWLARERQGCVLVTEKPVAAIEAIEAAVLDRHAHDPRCGLSILLRLRCLIAALGSHRFRHLIRGQDQHQLGLLVAVAARLRLNAGWGFSPVRLSWAVAALADAVAMPAAQADERIAA